MNILLIDNGSLHLDSLSSFLSRLSHNITLSTDISIAANNKYDFVILSGGGHHHAVKGNEKYYSKELDFLKIYKGNVLGICLGFELLAHAYGGSLHELPKKEEAILSIEILQPKTFGNIEKIEVYEAHRWAVNRLSSHLWGLAKSKDGYEIIRHKTKPLFGFQFHPEMMTNAKQAENLFRFIFGQTYKSALY